jgi:hypothetical protein
MFNSKSRIKVLVLVVVLLTECIWGAARKEGKSPLDELPGYIRQVTHFGERADFSHDGRRILFIEKTFGDVYEVELQTGIIRPMTHHYFHEGYMQAYYMLKVFKAIRRPKAEWPWQFLPLLYCPAKADNPDR